MAAESKECNICGITKSIGNFSANRGACNKCRTSRNRDRQNSTVELFLGARLTSIKQRHKQKNYAGTLVSLEYLMSLYEQQRGICAISNIPMHTSTDYSDLCASPDRIDTNKGYVEGNIRFVCARINLMRNDMDDHDFVWWCKAVVNNHGN